MIRRDLKIVNKLGLHARAASKFVELASGFISHVELIKGDKRVNGKSIMGIMMLAAARGTELTLTADGEDETEAAAALGTLVQNRFGEEE